MKFTVKTLLQKCHSQRSIAKELSISRKTIRRYKEEIDNDCILTPKIQRGKKLDLYFNDIKEWYSQGLTGVLIRERLINKNGLNVGYATVSRFLNQFKTSEVYISLIADPAEEAQVDFGYIGRFYKDGKLVKVWCFSMVLSHSRYSYHKIVTNQSVSTFINCHIESFEYFGGLLQTVKIDNLKAGVMVKPGVGKTHIANTIGLEAIKQGYTVMFLHINDLIDKINCAKADGSIIIATNRNFEDWGNVFGDFVMASAIIDRIFHHAIIIKINSESYRIKNFKNDN